MPIRDLAFACNMGVLGKHQKRGLIRHPPYLKKEICKNIIARFEEPEKLGIVLIHSKFHDKIRP